MCILFLCYSFISVYQFLFTCSSFCQPVCQSASLSVCVCLSVCLSAAFSILCIQTDEYNLVSLVPRTLHALSILFISSIFRPAFQSFFSLPPPGPMKPRLGAGVDPVSAASVSDFNRSTTVVNIDLAVKKIVSRDSGFVR